MEFRILGPLQVLDGAVEVPLASAKERALLAVLLLHAGAVVSRDRLVDELWGASPPPTAGKALNVHVSHLRKAFECRGHASIVTRPPGYALDVEPETIDVTRFERLVGEARERTAAGDIRSARRLLCGALALWRGPVLAGIDLESEARHEAARLEELRLAAQMDRIDGDLALGLHERLVGELDALVAEHPVRERLRSQLMLALYRSGRQADALRCYREARETLVGELGIEPSVPLQRLEKAILNHDPSLEMPSGIGRGEPTASLDLSGTVVVLFVDARDIRRFIRELGPGEVDWFLREYQRLLTAVFEELGGRGVVAFFDTVSASFPTAQQAGLAAAAGQRAIAAFRPGLTLKVGLDAGSVSAAKSTGPVALRSAAICNDAEGGQILVSQAVASLLENEGLHGFTLEDLGERSVGGVPGGRVRVYELAVHAVAEMPRPGRHFTPSQTP